MPDFEYARDKVLMGSKREEVLAGKEKLMTAYLQFDVQQDIGGGEITGNFGVQAINTEQNSTGLAFVDLDDRDVARHRLVRDIITAFADHERGTAPAGGPDGAR